MHRGFCLVHSDLGALVPQPLGVEQRFIVEAVKFRRLYVSRGNGRAKLRRHGGGLHSLGGVGPCKYHCHIFPLCLLFHIGVSGKAPREPVPCPALVTG